MKKDTLQIRITVIVGIIMTAACLLLTANSLFSARRYYGDYAELLEEGLVEYDPVLPDGVLPPAIEPDFYQTAVRKFSFQSVIAMMVIGILALALTYAAVGRMLRSLKELTRSVGEVNDGNLDRRVELKKAQGEVLELTDSFNRMLSRLEEAFLIQKSFAANAAHELKTPLSVMKSSLQVLEMDPNPGTEDYREFMADTKQSLDRIIKTVEGLLSLANLKDVPADSEVEVYPLIKQAVQELSAAAHSGNVALSAVGTDGISVYGNPDLLYRVFCNLIENAVKYNRPGGTVLVTLRQDADKAYVEVADDGIGIGEEALSHIFEPFYRADQSRSQKIPGSGLGLAVVKMIMERHNGEIEAESAVGEGTKFLVTLKKI